MRGLLVLAGVVLLSVGLMSTSAWALSEPGWYAGHSASERQAIVDYAYERSAHATVPYTGEAATTADAMSQSVADSGAHEFPLASELGAEDFAVEEGVGLLPEVGPAAPLLAAAGGTFAIGYAIGTGARKLFATLTAPDGAATGGSGEWSWNGLRWQPFGTEIFFGATVQQRPGAYVYSGGFNGSSFPIVRWFDAPCDFSGFTPPSGARMQSHLSTTATCREFVNREFVFFPVFVDYPYLLESDIKPQRPLRPFNAATDSPVFTVEAKPDPGTSTVEAALGTLDADGNDLLRSELDWALTPGSQEEEEPVRIGAPTTEDDRACKEFFGDAPGSDPGARAPEAEPRAADWDFDVEAFEGVFNPLIASTQTVKLRWGTEDWGYRHIVIGHGWDPGSSGRTRLALQTDTTPTLSPRDASRKSFVYRYDIPGLPGGMSCRQVVAVSYRMDGLVPVGRHIITSFVEAF